MLQHRHQTGRHFFAPCMMPNPLPSPSMRCVASSRAPGVLLIRLAPLQHAVLVRRSGRFVQPTWSWIVVFRKEFGIGSRVRTGEAWW